MLEAILELKVDENYAVRDRLMACTNFHNFQNCFIEFLKENHHYLIGMLLNNSMNALLLTASFNHMRSLQLGYYPIPSRLINK